jgi:hypothetical protein
VPSLSKKLLSTGEGGGAGRSDYEKFLLDSIFPTKLTEFPTKLTEFVPFIFIISQYCQTVKRILPDWLCLPNKLGGGCRPLRPVRPCLVVREDSKLRLEQPFVCNCQCVSITGKNMNRVTYFNTSHYPASHLESSTR